MLRANEMQTDRKVLVECVASQSRPSVAAPASWWRGCGNGGPGADDRLCFFRPAMGEVGRRYSAQLYVHLRNVTR